ncbi:hypothetical protein BD779DRAFT_1807134 [Infundibulicybe gibba]|nr:hypothetical protein BD779DRAFT_1807134 [Infundibulicybe gibba]
MDDSPSQIPDNLCMSFCTGSALFGTGCLLTDIPCICASAQFESSFDRCTISSCSSGGSEIAQQSHAQRCSAGSSIVSSSTTSIQSQSLTPGTTNSTLTTSNFPKSSNILIASSIPSASGTPTPPPLQRTTKSRLASSSVAS